MSASWVVTEIGVTEISFPRLGWKLREAHSSHQLSRTDDCRKSQAITAIRARNYCARPESQAI